MRQIVLDTETTGISPNEHRIIEIGCVEVINRKLTGNHFHVYINPQREVEQEAIAVHGITNEFLADKPLFAQIAEEFIEFIRGAQLVIHNAPFDVGFMDMEFSRVPGAPKATRDICTVLDTLVMAREKHPGQKNSLDALCKRYFIDNSHRELHGALLDAEILADVYLMMTGGQTALSLSNEDYTDQDNDDHQTAHRVVVDGAGLPVIAASAEEAAEHDQFLAMMARKSEAVIWKKY
ncbi:DNA polymerase III subunit epsilon [Gynuella sp.]|uniref:DNA polymerase III subunit epsilon n=1 Tax=Gynuella sp. TaxID=2969146 RepID=UPI003D0B84F7